MRTKPCTVVAVAAFLTDQNHMPPHGDGRRYLHEASLKHIVDAIADATRNAINAFGDSHGVESIYAIALIPSSLGEYVHCAIATEERLAARAKTYKNNLDPNSKRLWLRWANPDDGWFQDTHQHFDTACELLSAAIRDGTLSEFDKRIPEMMCDALRIIAESDDANGRTYSVTHGEDPQEFVYWASRINDDERMKQLQLEFAASQEAEDKIEI